MSPQHKELAAGRWFTLSLVEQMGNIGSEVERSFKWRKAGNEKYANLAFDRVLELIDLTIRDPKMIKRLREIVRVREALVDFFLFDNEYNSSEEIWKKYFFAFAYAARLRQGK